MTERELHSKEFEIVRHFDDLPDSAVVSVKITALVLGCSERTIRYHPDLPRVQIAGTRYGINVGSIRRIMRTAVNVAKHSAGTVRSRCFVLQLRGRFSPPSVLQTACVT